MKLCILAAVALALVAPASARAAAIDIHGAHTTPQLGGCGTQAGPTCAYVIRSWSPGEGGTAKLPFERSGTLTHLKMPFHAGATIYVRVVRRRTHEPRYGQGFDVIGSSPPIRARRGWLNTRLRLRVRAGDTIAIGLRGRGGPYVDYEDGRNPPGKGVGQLYVSDRDSAKAFPSISQPCCGGEDVDGLSMILTFTTD